MMVQSDRPWPQRVVEAPKIVALIKPGMTVWIGSGPAEPRLVVKAMVAAQSLKHSDAEMVQAIAGGPALVATVAGANPLRLKTFAGSGVAPAARAGRIDLIPSPLSAVPALIRDGLVHVDMVVVRVSMPDDQGFCSLGPCPDVTQAAMEKAAIVVGEITPGWPSVGGATRVKAAHFTHFVVSDQPVCPVARPVAGPSEKAIALHLAGVIGDGATLCAFPGPLFEALPPALAGKSGLTLFAAWFTDAAMDLVEAGICGSAMAGYAAGGPHLMARLNGHRAVHFLDMGHLFDPARIGCQNRVVTVVPAAAVDLGGRFVVDPGDGPCRVCLEQVEPFVLGARICSGGLVVAALAGRTAAGDPGPRLALDGPPAGTADIVVTEQGAVRLRGLTLRERAQAIIDIAHPTDRIALVEAAKAADILYRDQVFLAECALDHPSAIAAEAVFKGNLRLRFRPIRPSDEEGMRRLFYRFSKEAVYYRYFSPVAAMPHEKMQAYVNADCADTVAIVGLVEQGAGETIVAEARYVAETDRPWAEVAFVVDESVQGKGIATFVYRMLVDAARQRGIRGFTAQVLATNKAMLSVFEKGGTAFEARLSQGVYDIRIPFS